MSQQGSVIDVERPSTATVGVHDEGPSRRLAPDDISVENLNVTVARKIIILDEDPGDPPITIDV
jgi:hypothetical protein